MSQIDSGSAVSACEPRRFSCMERGLNAALNDASEKQRRGQGGIP